MAVQIVPVGLLRPFFSEESLTVEAAGRTVQEALAGLPLDPDLVAVVLINGAQQPQETVLQDGDVVKLIPFVGGG